MTLARGPDRLDSGLDTWSLSVWSLGPAVWLWASCLPFCPQPICKMGMDSQEVTFPPVFSILISSMGVKLHVLPARV